MESLVTEPEAVPSLNRAQWSVLATCVVAWLFYALLVPQSDSVDVYLFRDAAMNWVQGHGFTTASFEKSTSFAPVLYSNYTPLSQWLFIPFAELVHPAWRAASLYSFVLAAAGSLGALGMGLRVTARAWQRWMVVLLTGAGLPAGFIAGEADRPEALSFVFLLLVLWTLSRSRGRLAGFAWAGLLSGFAFLSEPFAGVLGVLLVAGAAASWAFRGDVLPGLAVRRLLVQGVAGAALFVLPVAATAIAFQHKDPGAMARFNAQAKYAGTKRLIEYKMSADQTDAELAAMHDSLGQKLRWGLGGEASSLFSALRLLGFVALALGGCALAAVACGRKPGAWAPLAALAVMAVLPALGFPLQANYQLLAGGVIISALALGWAGLQARRMQAGLWGLFALETLLVLPFLALKTVSGLEVRHSYLRAMEQARNTAAYLQSHGLGQAVLVVPPSDYFIYKPVHGNIYNGNYYARVEGTSAVGGLVECKNSTKDLSETPLSPELPGTWRLLSTEKRPVTVTLFGHRLMRSNWSLGCDVYVRPSQGTK